MSKDIIDKAAQHWSKISSTPQIRKRWWQSKSIIRHINKVVCGEPINGFGAGLKKLAKTKISNRKLKRGISIGCGNGAKEMVLIEQGIVEFFDLFEISEVRVAQGKDLAYKKGLDNKIKFHTHDPFKLDLKNSYDLVYWDNSLHHMLNVDDAVKWTYEVLRSQGMLLMDDFVGPSRFQWTDRSMEFASKIREILPEKYLKNPDNPSKLLSRKILRPNIKTLIQHDPTEAADSDRIIPSILKYFPNADLKFTGGCIYHLALNDVLANIDEEEDSILLELILLTDEALSYIGENHYAVCIALKS